MSSDRKNTGSNGHLINKHTIIAKWLLLVKVSACLLYIAYTHNTLHKHAQTMQEESQMVVLLPYNWAQTDAKVRP